MILGVINPKSEKTSAGYHVSLKDERKGYRFR